MQTKQTVVDWLAKELYTKMEMKGSGEVFDEIIKQANKIFQHQIINAWWNGHDTRDNSLIHPSEDCNGYYNETYGSKGTDDQVPDVRKMVEDDNYLTPVDWLMDRIKWINKETYDYLIKEGQYDRAKRMESSTSSQTEISDEEIKKAAHEHGYEHHSFFTAATSNQKKLSWIAACKWYREQLKKKQ